LILKLIIIIKQTPTLNLNKSISKLFNITKGFSGKKKGTFHVKNEKSRLVTADAGYSNLIMVEELKKLYKIKLYMDEVKFNFKDFV
jgi:hypothetical protein